MNINEKEEFKISVILPVYNARNSVEMCINSVLSQTYNNFEIIAIDDGSEDNSFEILKHYAQIDHRITIKTKQNEGPGLTRNYALDIATGDIVVFLDSDDYIENDYFELLIEKIIKEQADVVFIDIAQETPDGIVIRNEKMSKFAACSRKYIIGCQMTGKMPWGGVRKAAKRSLIEKFHIRYSNDQVGEEAIFSFELLRHADRVAYIKKTLYHYINHPNSQSKIPNNSWENTLDKMTMHLESEGIRKEYSDEINAFAFTVLILWILRIAKREKTFTCLKMFKEKRKNFATEYGWNLRRQYLRTEVRILFPVVKIGILLPVTLAAKLVKR